MDLSISGPSGDSSITSYSGIPCYLSHVEENMSYVTLSFSSGELYVPLPLPQGVMIQVEVAAVLSTGCVLASCSYYFGSIPLDIS
jgi:hypothetical protein